MPRRGCLRVEDVCRECTDDYDDCLEEEDKQDDEKGGDAL